MPVEQHINLSMTWIDFMEYSMFATPRTCSHSGAAIDSIVGSSPKNEKADLDGSSAGAVNKVGLLFNEPLGCTEVPFAKSSVA